MVYIEDGAENDSAACDQTIACLRLWAARLELAVRDFRSRSEDLKKSAKHYLFIDDQHHIGSFNWVCLVFNRDPDTVREMIYPDWRKDILGKQPKPGLAKVRRKPDFKWSPSGVSIGETV